MLPKDKTKRAHVRAFYELINSGIQPFHTQRILGIVGEGGMDKARFAEDWVNNGVATLEKFLATSSGKYCIGDEVTLADVFFYPQIKTGIARFKVNIPDFPNCQKVLKNLSEL